MITFKSALRLTGIVVAILIFGLLASGAVVWGLAATSKPERSATAAAADTDRVKAMLKRRMQNASGSEPSKATAATQLLLLADAVRVFREDAVNAIDTKAVAGLPQIAPGALQPLLDGKISREFPYIWSYVLAGAVFVIGDTLGDEPTVGFYNPYFDVALLTKWRYKSDSNAQSEAGFRLTEAVPVTGRAFIENRDSRATDAPIWTDSKALFEVRIVHAAQTFAATFQERYPPLGDGTTDKPVDVAAVQAAVAAAENRVFYLLKWVIDAQDADAPVNFAAAIGELRDALVAPSPESLEALLPKDNPQSANLFFELSADIRAGMKPYLVVEQNVIFIDPINLPTAFISVYFERAGQGYAPGLVSLFNLEADYPGQ
jgi:hypothetical protein